MFWSILFNQTRDVPLQGTHDDDFDAQLFIANKLLRHHRLPPLLVYVNAMNLQF
jgi:hypothetical protein